MNCADAVTRLSAALDGELSAADAREVRLHLGTCEACARRYRTLQQVRSAVRSAHFAPVDAARFDAGVLERVRHDAPAMRFSGAWIAAAAALVIAVSSAVLMIEERGKAPARSTGAAPVAITDRPGYSTGRTAFALDCGVAGASTCVIDGSVPLGLMAGN